MSAPEDLHGSAPDRCAVVLLLIDVVNALDFPEGDELRPHAEAMADVLADLKRRARAAGVPTVYVNDNFGHWRSDFAATVEHAAAADSRGRSIVERLKPADEDYFVLKPTYSGFHGTVLELLLRHLGAETLVLGGMAANLCVAATAQDAQMRDYRVIVPPRRRRLQHRGPDRRRPGAHARRLQSRHARRRGGGLRGAETLRFVTPPPDRAALQRPGRSRGVRNFHTLPPAAWYRVVPAGAGAVTNGIRSSR